MLQRNDGRSWGGITSDILGDMFELDENGKLQFKVGGALYYAPDGSLRIRTGSTLTEDPGSPIELNADPRANQFTRVTEEIVDGSVSELTLNLQVLRDLLTSPLAGMVFGRGDSSAGSGEWITLERGLTMNGTALGFVAENLTSDPVSPAVGQIWLRTDL